ncbi:hypothetical protein PGTUg99_021036 [Puccinia graminis f. sp. tritici]|uniref:Uncharacterized protein n=1 Tax=Puccinia graminis f. sp. tritici TaxID=56615 RepID=A0A5B0PCJ6_PUCGR|nr:hypothetical protein PGTUg99_021036 [Puccinia graminis f. sp. tritici]
MKNIDPWCTVNAESLSQFEIVVARALPKMYQPCHRCDRARSAISVPSRRRSSFLSVGISPFPLVRSLSLLPLPGIQSTATKSRLRPCNSTVLSLLLASVTFVLSSSSGRSLEARFPAATASLCPTRLSIVSCTRVFDRASGFMGSLYSCRQGSKKKPSALRSIHPHVVRSSLLPPLHASTSLYHPNASPLLETAVDPSIDIGVRYYPDRDQWSPVFNPNVVPDHSPVGAKAPLNSVGDKDPVDVKPTVDAKEKGPAKATVDPASINTILPSELACSASLVYIPKGMEIVETRTHYFPLKDKWHAVNDPSRRYDCPHPFVCVPWSVHDPELPPGLPVPFLRNLNSSVPAPSQLPSTSSSESSSNHSDASSTYPLISNYINLNHQGVQKLLLDDNTPPTAVCIYTEEDVMRIFEGIAPEYVDMCSEYPPSSLAESDRRVMFFENMKRFFRNKRSTYLSTRKF